MSKPPLLDSLSLRSATKADNRFLRDLYCTSRDYELVNVPWPADQLQTFLKSQFSLQQKHYAKVFPKADKMLVVLQDQPIGRIYSDFDRRRNDLRLIDITLLREFRGQGIGRYLIEQLIAKANKKRAIVSLHVHRFNPAQKLYVAMGFTKVAENDGYFLMQINKPS